MPEEHILAKDAAERKGYSKQRMSKLIKDGRIPGVKRMGRNCYVPWPFEELPGKSGRGPDKRERKRRGKTAKVVKHET